MNRLISPYGEELVNLIQRPVEVKEGALNLASLDLPWSAVTDLELLMTGAYSPLTGYMGRRDYESVLKQQTLSDGTYWPLPITLEVPDALVSTCQAGVQLALRDPEGMILAILTVNETWTADTAAEAMYLGRAADARIRTYVAGKVEGAMCTTSNAFSDLRLTPAQLRAQFASRGWQRVIALQTRQPLTRAQHDFALHVAGQHDANLLLHLMVENDAITCPRSFALIRSFQAALAKFPGATTKLAILPMPAKASGPRELALRAIVARNYGVSHLIVGGVYSRQGTDRRGSDMQDRAKELTRKIGINFVSFPRMLYAPDSDRYQPEEQITAGTRSKRFTGEEMQRRLMNGAAIPGWYMFPEVLTELRRGYPARDSVGFTVFFTGLSGSGKSTMARVLSARIMEITSRPVTLLDGDLTRKHLSSELGFSREHRDINIRRIGFVAGEITKHRGIAVCAPIAPYAETRQAVRNMVGSHGGFVEVYVATPLEVCEERDRKGLYARARAGLIKEFTGISDPYEIPEHPELTLDASTTSVEECVESILLFLEQEGYLRATATLDGPAVRLTAIG